MYEVGGFSEYLYNCNTGDEVRIEGPFGRGLEITEGTFYAFCGGTGVLPLLDLIYEILLKIYFLHVEKKHLNRLPDRFKFVLYLAIGKTDFMNGLELITKTYLLSKKYGLDIFDLRLRISTG
jgi:ferredoxin-NADP reductase